MRDYHGEMLLPDGRMTQFRYGLDAETEEEAVVEIETETYTGATVLWVASGFIPEDKKGWEQWSMDADNFAAENLPIRDPRRLVVKQLPPT